jgi:aminocarboxymuconate-semialdehyde decarboxylase
MTIDVFCHIYPEQYLSELRKCDNLSFEDDQSTGVVAIINKVSNSFVGLFKKDSHFSRPELRLDHMQKYGVDMQILTIGLPGLEPAALGVTPEQTLRIAKVANDAMSDISEKFPDRFVGIAEIPVQLPSEALDEIDRALNTLGLKGIQIYTQMGGLSPDSKELVQIHDKINKFGVPILIHPTNPLPTEFRGYERDSLLYIVWGWPYETTLALSRIALSGLLDKFPNLKFVSHHLGGMIPYFAERITGIYEEFASATGFTKSSALMAQFRRMYHDTAVYGHLPALKCGYSVFGSEHIVYATDYPFGPDYGEWFMKTTAGAVNNLDVPEDEKEKIRELNARKIFKLS